MGIECRFRLSLALLLSLTGAACGGGDDDAAAPGDPPGHACTMDGICGSGAIMCFGVGTFSSCESGGLCVGTGTSNLTCALPCSSDADCSGLDTATTCLLDCAEPLFNGQCVEPAAASSLLSFPFCETPAAPRRGISGSTG